MSEKLFGTDGIRSRAGRFPLNAVTIEAIGQAIGEKLGGTVLVGYDTRMSCPWIFGLLKNGIERTSAVVHDAGVIPTPAVALLVKSDGYSGGIMISASHNPFNDNGVKVFSANGTKLSDAAEIEIEKRVYELLDGAAKITRERQDVIPDFPISAANHTGYPERYAEKLLSIFPEGQWLKGQPIAVDCANGAMSEVAPEVLRRLGAEVRVIHASPTGTNINAKCGAVHLESLTEEMSRTRAIFGVAFDGDGDRALFVSMNGKRVDGDAVLALMAGVYRAKRVVGTSMTNYALEQLMQKQGRALVRVEVGDRFIFEEMQRTTEVCIGGEPSGHIIFPDFGLSGDGLLTALKVAETVVKADMSLDELCLVYQPAPHLLRGIRVEKKIPLTELPQVQQKIAEVQHALTGRGRIVVRYSGTEPLLRVMIESDDAVRNEKFMEEILEAARNSLEKIQIHG
jgi:phosphoglucosamine mutase